MIMNGQFLQVNWLVDISLQSGAVFHYLSYSYWHIFTFLHLLTLTSRSTQRRGRQWYCWPCRWYGRVSMSHCPDKSIDVWNVRNWTGEKQIFSAKNIPHIIHSLLCIALISPPMTGDSHKCRGSNWFYLVCSTVKVRIESPLYCLLLPWLIYLALSVKQRN